MYLLLVRKHLKLPEKKTVTNLDNFFSDQKQTDRFKEKWLGKTIEVRHYYVEYEWDFYVHYPNPLDSTNRVIFYPYNFV